MSVKRYATEYDWLEAHEIALHSVAPHQARNLFRKCHIPGTEAFIDEEENKKRKRIRNTILAYKEQSEALLNIVVETVAACKRRRII